VNTFAVRKRLNVVSGYFLRLRLHSASIGVICCCLATGCCKKPLIGIRLSGKLAPERITHTMD